ncbi:MAG: ABC transporter substrate-binding protein [Desulfobacterota bacterium]|nr:ABC transporter substrate-binding protein [Thermodesulfobacteriota bacterium]MDW8002326.1 ABC transporter substrate-binding protein [Deltaproteobacteria bacterium]
MGKKLLCAMIFILLPLVLGHTKEAQFKLTVGVLPILDVLPIYVAEEKGYFNASNLDVEIIPCASAAERDQLVAAGSLDVIINDLVSLALFNKERVSVIGVRYAMVPKEKFFQFAIVSSKSSNITSASDLKGVPIGISQATIVHYLTERLLLKEGFKYEEIKTVPIPRIPDRLAALTRGELKAACLPEPFATLAMSMGARLILDDRRIPTLSGSLYSVSKRLLEKNPKSVKVFLSCIDRAITDINADKERSAKLLIEKKLIPSPLFGSYPVPEFPKPKVPEESAWNDVIQWLSEKNLIGRFIPYSESISTQFLKR